MTIRILSLNKENTALAIAALSQGKTIIYPTETAYGLGGNVLNRKVVQKIYEIKDRPKEKPLTVIVASLNMAHEFFEFDDISASLAKRYWPGALTLLLYPKTNRLDALCESGSAQAQKKVGVRVSSHEIPRALSAGIEAPIIATSANLSGAPTCYTKEDIQKQFGGRVHMPDFLLDGGSLQKTPPSTIIAVEGGRIQIIRQGAIVVT